MENFLDKIVEKKYSELEPFIANRVGTILREKIDSKKAAVIAKVVEQTKG